MQWLALREAWWPLAVAVAWVLLRSRPVVEQLLNRHSRKPITFRTVDIYAADLKAGGQHTTPEFENSDAAFDELRHHLETGEIEIVGTPFVRVGDLEGSSRLEMGNQQTIFFSEMSSLVPYDDHGDLCLIPRDWRAAHGSTRTNLRGYRNVLVRSAALVGPSLRKERNSRTSRPMLSSPPASENIAVETPNESAPSADPSTDTSPLSGPPGLSVGIEAKRTHLSEGGERPPIPLNSHNNRASSHSRRVNEPLVPFEHFIQTVFLIRPPCRMRSYFGASAIGSKSKSCPVFRTLHFESCRTAQMSQPSQRRQVPDLTRLPNAQLYLRP